MEFIVKQAMQGCSLVSASVIYVFNRMFHKTTLSLLAEAIHCTTTIFANIVTEMEAYLVMLRLQTILASLIGSSYTFRENIDAVSPLAMQSRS